MFKKTIAMIFAILVGVSISATAIAEIQLKSYQAGVFQRPEMKLNDGERYVSRSAEHVRVTDHVPAKLGVKFGVNFSVRGKQSSGNQLTYLYLTPGVVEPDGTRHDKYEELVELDPNESSHIAAFEFTESWEVVVGKWELLIFEGNRLLLRKAFNVSTEEEDVTPRITPVKFD